MSKLILWGASGHGKVVLDIARAQPGFAGAIFLDDWPGREAHEFQGCRIAGSRPDLARLRAEGNQEMVIAIGSNSARAHCFQQAVEAGFTLATLVHPSAVISPSAKIGRGTVVMANAVLNADCTIGENCIINSGAVVEHDCVIGAHVHISPRVALGGNVTVGSLAHVGIGAIVLPGAVVGEKSVVGAGAVVLREAPARSTVVGVPAKLLALRMTVAQR